MDNRREDKRVSKRFYYIISVFYIILVILTGCQSFNVGTDHQSKGTSQTATTLSTETSDQTTSILETTATAVESAVVTTSAGTTKAPSLPSSSATLITPAASTTREATKATTVPTTKKTTFTTITPTSTTTAAGTTAAPTTSSEILEGEFIVINVYLVSSIAYHRAILVDGSDIFLLSCSGTPYAILYDINTGLKNIIKLYVKDETFSLKLDNHEYAWKTSLEEKYLPTAARTVYIGRTGINIHITGNKTTAITPTLQGIVVFAVSTCDITS
jgi:hypothetical protein